MTSALDTGCKERFATGILGIEPAHSGPVLEGVHPGRKPGGRGKPGEPPGDHGPRRGAQGTAVVVRPYRGAAAAVGGH